MSFPLTWPELAEAGNSDFRIHNVSELLGMPGPDAWRRLVTERARLPSSLLEP